MANWHKDYILKSPYRNTPLRADDLTWLYPPFRAQIEKMPPLAAQGGMKIMIFETYRSPTRQLDMFNTKKSKLKTNGMHMYGVAADLVFADRRGRPTWKEPFPGAWKRLGALGRALGLYWGGDWKKLVDCPHFQYIPATFIAQNKIRLGIYPK